MTNVNHKHPGLVVFFYGRTEETIVGVVTGSIVDQVILDIGQQEVHLLSSEWELLVLRRVSRVVERGPSSQHSNARRW